MNFLKAKISRPSALGGSEIHDILINLDSVYAIGYIAASTETVDGNEVEHDSRLKLFVPAAEPLTLRREEAERVWKIVQAPPPTEWKML